jgi:hypothetical protein
LRNLIKKELGVVGMLQIFNWICLICICFLVGEVMIYFCKDAFNIYNHTENKRVRNVEKASVTLNTYEYQNKLAK